MKKTLKITLIFLIIIFSKLLITYIMNEYIIINYNKGQFKDNIIKILKVFNTNEPYIVYYNEGNIFYQKGDYEEAINNYDIAINKHPKKNRICDIRINKTLAMIKLINYDTKEEVLKRLKEARENLYNDNCAHEEDDNGDSQDAEQLEKIIKDAEEQINNGKQEQNNNSKPNDNEISSKEEKSLEKQLEELEKQSNSSRQSDLDSFQELENYDYYPGKRW